LRRFAQPRLAADDRVDDRFDDRFLSTRFTRGFAREALRARVLVCVTFLRRLVAEVELRRRGGRRLGICRRG
jgi:hypothetical protein